MTLQSFKNLTPKQKRRALLRKGIYLADRTTSSFSVFLFRLGDLFVELFFIRENDEVVCVRPVKAMNAFRHYNLKGSEKLAIAH